MNIKNWSTGTKFLHLGMVLTITFQLLISLVMEEPESNISTLEYLAFQAHSYVGLLALFIVVLHWLSFLVGLDGGFNRLFPWGHTGRNEILKDLGKIRHGDLELSGKQPGLVSFVHGLGLLAVTIVALTGAVIFILLPESSSDGVLFDVMEEFHEEIAGLVWFYWFAHGGMAIFHHILGHDSTKEMFQYKKSEKNHLVNTIHSTK